MTFPLSLPGVVAGTLLTFIPASGDYINAELLGSTEPAVIGNVIQTQFLRVLDYPTAAALSFILMAAILLDGHRLHPQGRNGGTGLMQTVVNWLRSATLVVIAGLLALGYLHPARTSSCWSSRSTSPKGRFNYDWNAASPPTPGSTPAASPTCAARSSLSLQIALCATLGATVLGTMIAFALARYRFRGRGAINTLIFLPMAMPEVVMGASLLHPLPQHAASSFGFWTILIAHIMFCLSFVVIAVKARVMSMDPRLEQAAQDLYATPVADLPAGHPAAGRARHRAPARCCPSRCPSTTSSSPTSTRASPSPSRCSSGARRSAAPPCRST